jgi:CDP-6-deoxy-D-xylo-4-hexulose-3-dehydrase
VVGDLTNTDKIMNDAFFVGVYPGLTPAMLDYVEEVFGDFFHAVRRTGQAVA